MALANWAGSAVLTIADWAGSSIVDNIVSTTYSYLHDRTLPADCEAELKRLEAFLPQITTVMGIAEALKMKHPNASQWVEEFRQALEASEDVLDELEYKKLEDMVKNRDEAGGSASSSKKRKPCTINYDETFERLKNAVAMLDRAANGVDRLLQAAIVLGIHDPSETRQEAGKALGRETTSFLAEKKVYGRDVEKDKIIGWLKQPTNSCLSSFGIVGVGGVGKTTLVQFVYQEMWGSNHFDKTIWVCVSTNFNVEDITRKMLGELGENSCCGKSLNTLQETLKQKIHLKKILLVLDDVWDDEKRSDWEKLVAPLRFVEKGSKIIFTTRMKSVADLLASVIYTEYEFIALEGLREQELRLLFYSYAFHGSNPDNHKDLQTFGDQMLKMLRGSPLAAKVMGSLLNSDINHRHWRRILNHGSIFNLESSKDVVEVLKLSYYHLSADLQVCFRFCSIFPQDYLFDKNELIKMWIASGFIRQQLYQEEKLEDIGEDYFNNLLRKSFFEYSKSRKGERYVMHDLMHELVQKISTGECCRVESNKRPVTIPSTVRHVSVHESEIERISHLENLRSLVIIIKNNSFVLPNNLIKKNLRLLNLNFIGHDLQSYGSCELPEDISCLVHLRYLSIELDILCRLFLYIFPASICNLYHLEVLEFSTKVDDVIFYSGIETIRITNLVRLHYMRLPGKMMQIIHGVHKLASLQELTFFVGQESGQHINELGTLENLRHLIIENIENVGDPVEAKSANLLGKTNLMSLYLKWTSESNSNNIEQIIDYLQPHTNLMELIVENYKGQRSPRWMEESPPLKLSSLKLLSCPVWKNQLFSWQMPHLKVLDIYNCASLEELPDMPLSLIEFRIHEVGLTSLPKLYQSSGNNTLASLSLKSSLRVVHIKGCPNLISLNGFLQQDNLDLQDILELTISDCEKLVMVPAFGTLLSLKHLSIKYCRNLTECPSLPLSLTEFCIDNLGVSALPEYYQNSDSKDGPYTSSLRKVYISYCQNLISLNGFLQQNNIDFQFMEVIVVRYCKNLVHLPVGGFGKFVSLMNLTIVYCSMLMVVDDQSNLLPMSLKDLSVEKCGKLDEPLLESASSLVTLTDLSMINCANISHFPSSKNAFKSLSCLNIIGCDKLVEHSSRDQLHGVNQGSRLASLKINHLYIDNLSLLLIEPLRSLRYVTQLRVLYCSGMVSLPEQWLLQNSNTLRDLTILDASSLKSLPATMVRLTALKWLVIEKASLLEELLELPASLNSLTIRDASSLKSLPATMVRLTGLKYLNIQKADLLQELPELPVSLKKLTICDASSLKSLPSTMARLTTLELLEIQKVDLLQELPELPASLTDLTICGASSLKSLPTTMARLNSLEYLKVQNVDLLQEFPELPTSLCSLVISDASSLKSLPATMANLSALKYLKIKTVDLLKELPELPASLKEKKIQGSDGWWL
ncbi:disease resistance protein RGA2-like [Carex rostrata]